MSLAHTHLHPKQDMDDIAGIKIPDSQMARDLTQFIRDTESDLLFHHSTRVYLFGALTGERKGLKYDPELLYVGAMFHDIGLTDRYRQSQLRFEVKAPTQPEIFCAGMASRRPRSRSSGTRLRCTPRPASRSTKRRKSRSSRRVSRWMCSGLPMSSSLTRNAKRWSRRTRVAATSRTISSRPSMMG
jgi:hypothetical protein